MLGAPAWVNVLASYLLLSPRGITAQWVYISATNAQELVSLWTTLNACIPPTPRGCKLRKLSRFKKKAFQLFHNTAR